MGFTPREVDAMSLWEFTACADGFRNESGGRSDGTMSDDRMKELGIEGM